MVAIPKRVTERLSKGVTKYKRVLKKAHDRDVNESDTVSIITDMLSDVFGFDKYSEVTSEYCIRSTYCDLAVTVDDKIIYLLEAKAIGMSLKDNHLRQAVNYGATEGIPWVVLTNGIEWHIYKIELKKQVTHELVCSLNFLELSPRKKDDQDKLFVLCREGVTKDVLDIFHEKSQCVNKFVIADILASEAVVPVVRRVLRKMSPGLKVEAPEIEEIIRGEIIKREILESEKSKPAQSKVRKALKK